MPRAVLGRFRITDQTIRRPERPNFEPQYRLGPDVFEGLRRIERADQDLRRHEVGSNEARRLLEDALTRNAYGTASIEGNPLSLEDVQSLLAQGPTPEALARPEEREILNYAAFIETLPRRAPVTTAADICALHRELFAGVLPDAGRLKTQPNFVGRRPGNEVKFIPAAPERVKPELENALKWLGSGTEHPLVRIAVFFHEFESIHPFRDGNGRLGRALTTLLLHAHGYAGVRYALIDYEFNQDRDAYYSALTEVERKGFEYTQWIAYMIRVLRATFEGARERFAFRTTLPPDLKERQRQLAFWFHRLNSGAPQRRVKFHDVHAAHPTVPERTLKRDLSTLRHVGILEVEGERKGTRYRLARR